MDPYRVEPAKSNRSKCKACKSEIAKEQLRFGSLMEVSPGHGSYSWRCLDCITAKQVANVESKVGSADNVDGFDALPVGKQTQFRKAIDAALKKGGVKAKAKAKGKAAAEPKRAATKKAGGSGRVPPLKDQHAFLDLAKSFDFGKVRELIEKNPAYVNLQPSGRWTALHQAAQKGDGKMVDYLLEKGARLDLVNNDGQTPADVAKNAAIKAKLVPKPKKRGAAASGDAPAAKKAAAALGFYCSSTDPLSSLGCEDVRADEPFEVLDLNKAKAGKAKTVAMKLAKHLKGTCIPAGESDCSPLSFIVFNPLGNVEDTMFRVLGMKETDDDVNLRAAMSLDEVCWDEYDSGFCGEIDDEEDEDAEDMYPEGDLEKIKEATSVLADETEEHFKINFAEDLVCAPIVWGGFVDGHIVGVLGMRVWT
mmetsp:Transcript_34123/g.77862  ORF Transcript_34123/g.77862 Transcript_34123/m.77862 type:complete len:421 (-) Transcript_34123:115-1377(-)